MRIAFDAGHGAGQNRYQNYCEGDTMLELGKQLIQAIPNSFLTRTDGVDISLSERANRAKNGNADLLISLHTDWPATGTLTIYSIHRPQDKELATRIGESIAKALGTNFRGAITRKSHLGNWDYYGIIRNGVKQGISTIIVEHCGHTEMAVDTEEKIKKIVDTYIQIFEGDDTMVLKMGSRGEDVKKLQENLNKLGFNCGNADGIFGAKTEAAVKALQQKHGLAVDGIVGFTTHIKIAELLVELEKQAQIAALQTKIKQLDGELQQVKAQNLTFESKLNKYKTAIDNIKKIISEV